MIEQGLDQAACALLGKLRAKDLLSDCQTVRKIMHDHDEIIWF
jgi:hypothetical protein